MAQELMHIKAHISTPTQIKGAESWGHNRQPLQEPQMLASHSSRRS